MQHEDKPSSHRYPTGKLTLLQAMAFLAVTGLILAAAVKLFFA